LKCGDIIEEFDQLSALGSSSRLNLNIALTDRSSHAYEATGNGDRDGL